MFVPLDLRTRWAARPRANPWVARVRAVDWRPLLVALFVAVLLGLAGGSLGQWIGWRTAGSLPTDAEAEAIARLAFAGPVPPPERRDEFFGYDRNDAYGPGYVRFTMPADPAAASFPWQAKDIRVRLDTAGWAVDRTWAIDGPDEKSDPSRRASSDRAERVEGLIFVADKGDWRVRYLAGPGDEARLEIVRVAPIAVPAGGALGFLVFAGVGWLIGQRAARRFSHLGGFARRCARWLLLGSVLGMLAPLALTLVRLGAGHAQLSSPQIPLWTAFAEPVLMPLAVAAVILLCAAGAVVAGASVPEPAPAEPLEPALEGEPEMNEPLREGN
ncbi:hypothetical protein GCM10009557_18910 [Virgisporangium ochraceum]